MRFTTPTSNELESLQKQKEEIDRKIAIVKKVPAAWLEDYFIHHPNINVLKIYPEAFLDSVMVVFANECEIFDFMLKDIYVGIKHVVVGVRYKSGLIEMRLAKLDGLLH